LEVGVLRRHGLIWVLAVAITGALMACSNADGAGDGNGGGVPDATVLGDQDSTASSVDLDGADGTGFGDQDSTASSGDSSPGEQDVDTHNPVVVSHLQMLPADSMVIEVEQGEPAPLGLSVELVYSDGTTVPVEEAIWSTSNPSVVGIDQDTGPYATAIEWGQSLVFAYHQGLTAECSVTVKVNEAPPVYVEGMSDAEVVAFESGGDETAEGAPTWRYPEDQTVFPCGMYPPLLQWDGEGSKFFRLVFSNQPGITVTLYTDEQSYQPTRALWQAICDVTGGPLTMTLAGRAGLDDASPLRVAGPHVVKGANASLEGIVYYWQILPEEQSGTIVQIDSAAPVPETAFVFPDASSLPGVEQKGTCRGCHALSMDGSKLAYAYNGSDVVPNQSAGAKGLLAISLAEDPLPELVSPQPDYGAQAVVFDPTGTRIVVANAYGMWLGRLDEALPEGFENLGDIAHIDDTNGVFRPETPAWSPDGSTLIYARRSLVDNVPQGASLVKTQWDLETEQFDDGAVMFLDVDAVESRPWHDYPTWSPDSQWIVARASGTDLGIGQTPPDALDFGFTLIDASTGAHRSLPAGAPEGHVYGRPSFSPFMEGGYYWLAFYADRPYGKLKPEGVKQIWVMAIDVDPTDGVDPSHPSFWLPGQSIEGINLSAFWARPTCAVEADTCGEDGECCVGLACTTDPDTGAGTCQPMDCDLPGQFCDIKEETCCPDYTCQVSLSGVASCQQNLGGDDPEDEDGEEEGEEEGG